MLQNKSVFDNHNADVTRQRQVKAKNSRFGQIKAETDNLKFQILDLTVKLQRAEEKLHNLEPMIANTIQKELETNGSLVQIIKAEMRNPNAHE
jgi:hypothetical protein